MFNLPTKSIRIANSKPYFEDGEEIQGGLSGYVTEGYILVRWSLSFFHHKLIDKHCSDTPIDGTCVRVFLLWNEKRSVDWTCHLDFPQCVREPYCTRRIPYHLGSG